MILLVTLVFIIALDSLVLFLLYKGEIVKKHFILIPPSWYNTKKITIYFSFLIILLFMNIPFIVITYLRYSDVPPMKALMFLISVMYIIFILAIKNIIIRLVTKNFNDKKYDYSPIKFDEQLEVGGQYFDEIVNCRLQNNKKFIASFKLSGNQITLWKVDFFSLILKLLHLKNQKSFSKMKIANFCLSDIILVEKTRYLRSSKAFHIILVNKDEYYINFQQPNDALKILRLSLPDTKFIGFDDLK